VNNFIKVIFLLLLFSCSKLPEDKIKEGIIAYLNLNAKDPKSYELVSLKIVDTITVGKLAKNNIKEDSFNINNRKYKMESDKKLYNIGKLEALNKYQKEQRKIDSNKINEYENQILKCKSMIDREEVLGYIVSHRYRLKNGLGGLDLFDSWVYVDKDLKFLGTTEAASFTYFHLPNN
jgi:hypothetical protein